MNRFIMARLGVFFLLSAFAAVGCAIDSSSSEDGDQTEQGDDGSSGAGIGSSSDEQISAGENTLVKHSSDPGKPDNGVCPGCGPLPDPWKKMGPLPDPWTSPGSSSSGSSGTSSSSSSGGSGGSSSGKP